MQTAYAFPVRRVKPNRRHGAEVLVSRTPRDLAVGSKIAFDDRGMDTLKGVSEPWQVFAARC
jgi:hypothetical protein